MSNYSFRAHAASDRRKWVVVTIAILLIAAVIVTGCLTDWFTNWNKYCLFGHDYGEDGICTRCGAEKSDEVKKEADSFHNESVLATVIPGNGIALKATPLKRIATSPMAVLENSYSLTATITPVDAVNKAVTWSVAFQSSDGWAANKAIADYAEIQGDGLTVNVIVKKAFGSKIVVKCTSQDNPEASAECIFDYVKRITGFTFNMSNVIAGANNFSYECEYSDYTIDSTVSVEIGNTISLTDSFINKFRDSMYRVVDDSMELEGGYSGNYDDFYSVKPDQSAKNVPLSSNSTQRTITVGSGLKSLFELFIKMNQQWEEDFFDRCGTTPEAVFRSCLVSEQYDAEFEVTYKASYNGKDYSSGKELIHVDFDVSSFTIPVDGLSLNQSHIYA